MTTSILLFIIAVLFMYKHQRIINLSNTNMLLRKWNLHKKISSRENQSKIYEISKINFSHFFSGTKNPLEWREIWFLFYWTQNFWNSELNKTIKNKSSFKAVGLLLMVDTNMPHNNINVKITEVSAILSSFNSSWVNHISP